MLVCTVRWGRHALLFPTNSINKLPQLTLDSYAQLQAGLSPFQLFKENINNLFALMMDNTAALTGWQVTMAAAFPKYEVKHRGSLNLASMV